MGWASSGFISVSISGRKLAIIALEPWYPQISTGTNWIYQQCMENIYFSAPACNRPWRMILIRSWAVLCPALSFLALAVAAISRTSYSCAVSTRYRSFCQSQRHTVSSHWSKGWYNFNRGEPPEWASRDQTSHPARGCVQDLPSPPLPHSRRWTARRTSGSTPSSLLRYLSLKPSNMNTEQQIGGFFNMKVNGK